MGRQVFRHFQESRAPSFTTVTCEDKHHNSQPCCPFLLLPSAFISKHDNIRYKISLWSFGVSCPSCGKLSPILVHSSAYSLAGRCEKQRRP